VANPESPLTLARPRIRIRASCICSGVSVIIEREVLLGAVASAVAGDEAAFARIIAAHHNDVVRVGFLVTGEIELAHEAIQSAWLLAWRHLGTLRDPDRLRPWLMSIAANEARRVLRGRRRRRLVEIPVEDLGVGWEAASADGGDRDGRLDLRNALLHLKPDDRAVLAMRYSAGMTSDEIGRATGMSAPGVRSKLGRALARLRKELDHD
jgi:RNA polymerase sigma factor (sigma-70 family)